MTDAVLREVKDGLCTITLNKPDKLNALGTDSFKGLSDACDYITSHVSEIGCVLIKGTGRAFCAGNDLGGLTEVFEGGDSSRFRSDTVERLASLPMPVVAQVHGHCLTGGLELALAADIIIAGESAKFGDTHGKWDLVPVWGLSQRLPRRVGRAKALEMMFASRTYSGQEAAAMGLANLSVPDSELEAQAVRFCRDILANSGRATRAMNRLLTATESMPLSAGL